MMKLKTAEAVRERERERERELHFREINKTKDKGIAFDFVCDKLKDRNRVILI